LNAESKRIEEIRLASPFFGRDPPKVTVQPTLREQHKPISATASNEFLAVSLPKIEQFSKKLRLPLRFPLVAGQVERVEFFEGLKGGWLKLSNGYSFTYEKGIVTEFATVESIYGFRPLPFAKPPKPFGDYLGRWKLNEREAAKLVLQAVEDLGYAVKDFNMNEPPDVKKNKPIGKYVVPRYHLFWITNNHQDGKTTSMVSAEVNADKKRLEYLQLFGTPFLTSMESTNQVFPNVLRNPQSIQSEPPIEQQTLEFLERNMREMTNAIRTNPAVKPFDPFE
jgi:hypothetical protein